jgi:hypothetical protein
MEAETQKNPRYFLIAILIVLIAVLAFIVYYSIMEMRSPSKKLSEISDKYGFAKYEKLKLPKNITLIQLFFHY